ncbi:MAG: phosphoenolpyruvate--protein phosphotransferase [Bacteroidota bacterium]
MAQTEFIKLSGIAAAPGISMAPAFLFTKEIETISDETIENVNEALENLRLAIEKSQKELSKVFSLAVDKLGEKRAAIFEAQLMILDDPILIETIRQRIIDEKKSPEFIVDAEMSKYQQLMSASSEAYMKERSLDIKDIKDRIIRNLKKRKWLSKILNNVIVVASSLTPADSVLFSKNDVKGYVTNFGGLTSHTAIVARALDIPAVVGVHDATSKISDGDYIIVDGFHGEIIVNPTKKQIKFYEEKIRKINDIDIEFAKLKDKPSVTKDGREIKLYANLDVTSELDLILQNCANGIGLLRTEQIFQGLEAFPDEDVQFEFYKEVAEKLYPGTVTIRTFDIGGDKVLPFDVKEPNPMLGWRGVRFLLDNNSLYKSQIRAILKASKHKNVKIMIPMISSIAEIRRSKEILEMCKHELRDEGFEFDESIPFGIMIEVPSAAVMAEDYAEEVDFISVGTNDLIQYLLAVDRGNEIVNDLYQEFHPALIRTLDFIIKAGKITDTEVSICGEMAADQYAVPLLVGLGFESLSMSPSAIPVTKKIITDLNYQQVKKLVYECLHYKTESEIKTALKDFFNENLKEEAERIK